MAVEERTTVQALLDGGLAHGSLASGNRLDGEVGYGLPVGSRFVGTPTLGVGTSADGLDYRLGYSLGALGGAGTAFELGVDAQRPGAPPAGRHGSRRARAGHAAVVAAAPERPPRAFHTDSRSSRSSRARAIAPAARVRVIAAPRAARRRRSPPSIGRSPPFPHLASFLCARVAAGRRERPHHAVAHAALPRRGVPDGVLHLWGLLAGAGLLWGALPRDRATGPRAAVVRQASAQPGVWAPRAAAKYL